MVITRPGVKAMQDWMETLSAHYQQLRRKYPKERLLILFDIDGTILDKRYTLLYLLKDFDRVHGTQYFQEMQVNDIDLGFDQIDRLLKRSVHRAGLSSKIAHWLSQNRESALATFEAHRPHRGVLEVIRWFQLQPATYVGINSSRDESCRTHTLEELNRLGEEYRVRFSDEFLFLQAQEAPKVEHTKANGVRHFQGKGYRVFAVVDDDKRNLDAVAQADKHQEILLLHASTLFRGQRQSLLETSRETPAVMPWIQRSTPGLRTKTDAGVTAQYASGHTYALTPLLPDTVLPRHVEFVWERLYTEEKLERFLRSSVHWASIEVLGDPMSYVPRVTVAGAGGQAWLRTVRLLADCDRGIRLKLHPRLSSVSEFIYAVKSQGVDDQQLWLCGELDQLGENGFKGLRQAFPRAILECPIDFLKPLMLGAPSMAEDVLDRLNAWGVNRLSLSSRSSEISRLLDKLDQWGYDIHIRDVPNLEAFLRTVLLLPRSIAADFEFAAGYFDRPSQPRTDKSSVSTRREERIELVL